MDERRREARRLRGVMLIEQSLCRCGAPLIGSGNLYCDECRRKSSEKGKVRRERERAEVIKAYGGSCRCCGLDDARFLTIDHVHNDGAAHRRVIGSGIYRWLIRHGFPADGFQLLCFNCNVGRSLNGEVCPHRARAC